MKIISKIAWAFGLITIAVAGRFIPHFWNMTPVGAVAIFAGARLGVGWGVAVPIFSMFLADLFLGFYSAPVMLSVYGSLALTGLAGYFLGQTGKSSAILSGSVFSATVFFLITNGAVWFFSGIYPENFGGLISSYIAGLPFFKNQLIGDLFFTSALFVLADVIYWDWLQIRVFLKKIKIKTINLV